MARDRFVPDYDPDCGDAPLTNARHDIVIGRWQGLRELLRATGPDWTVRGHRVRLLAQVCAGSSTVELADLTNSPISLNFSRTNLLSTPNSLASSWTRVLATILLLA